MSRLWLLILVFTGCVLPAPPAASQVRGDLEVLNRCPFPIEVTHRHVDLPRGRVSLGTLQAGQRRTYRGALFHGRNELLLATSVDIPTRLVSQALYVNNPGPNRRPKRATLEVTLKTFGSPRYTKPKPPDPEPDTPDPGSFDGLWTSSGRGTLNLEQHGNTISGSLSGKAGEHWGPAERNGGSITKGTVDPNTKVATLNVTWGDNTTSVLTMKLSPDGKTFSGTWTWKGGRGEWDGVRGKR
jgi:hypothetical protein